MMTHAVYWQEKDDINCAFFGSEMGARNKVDLLIAEAGMKESDDGHIPDWDITLLRVIGEVQQVPHGDGSYALVEVKGNV